MAETAFLFVAHCLSTTEKEKHKYKWFFGSSKGEISENLQAQSFRDCISEHSWSRNRSFSIPYAYCSIYSTDLHWFMGSQKFYVKWCLSPMTHHLYLWTVTFTYKLDLLSQTDTTTYNQTHCLLWLIHQYKENNRSPSSIYAPHCNIYIESFGATNRMCFVSKLSHRIRNV